MTRITRFVLVALVCLLFSVAPVLAQEATPGDTPEPPAFAALIMLASGAFFVTEQFKPLLNAWRDRYDWTEHQHQFIVRLLAAASAIILIFSVPNDANIIAALGLSWEVPDTVAKVITALAVSGGATFLYALQTYFKFGTGVAVDVSTGADKPPGWIATEAKQFRN